jgi:hypothetical protein
MREGKGAAVQTHSAPHLAAIIPTTPTPAPNSSTLRRGVGCMSDSVDSIDAFGSEF